MVISHCNVLAWVRIRFGFFDDITSHYFLIIYEMLKLNQHNNLDLNQFQNVPFYYFDALYLVLGS